MQSLRDIDSYEAMKRRSSAVNKTALNIDLDEVALQPIKSQDIRVGDVIIINKDQRVPADCLLLKSFEENETCFIKTDQLDGETDWKSRKPVPVTQKANSFYDIVTLLGKDSSKPSNLRESLISKGYCFEVEAPHKQIYEFKGCYRLNKGQDSDEDISLGLENTMWASTVLASNKCVALVIYSGKETRAQLNSGEAKAKVGVLDQEVNLYSKLLFGLMVLFSVLVVAIDGFKGSFLQNVINFLRFIVLLSAIIPISLKVNLDISKAVNSWFIGKDKIIPNTIVRNSTLPEELGRIEMIFSDKTGTLTKNEMIFRKIYLDIEVFDEEKFSELQDSVKEDCKKSNAPMLDVKKRMEKLNTTDEIITETNLNVADLLGKRNPKNRPQEKKLRDAIAALALCNCVTPVYDTTIKLADELSNNTEQPNAESDNIVISNTNSSNSDQYKVTFQASSPDEVAMVKFAWEMNMKLINRTDKLIELKNLAGYVERYEILAEFPFTSASKRMGIIVRSLEFGHIIFYLKGAENVIEQFCTEDKKPYIKENSETLACAGLRTLVFSQKILTQQTFDAWFKDYNAAKRVNNDTREKMVADSISKLEKDMEYLCVTGVEDLLQDNVAETIEILQMANIKIWMLTGDKVETAKCIAISTNLKKNKQKDFTIQNERSEEGIKERIKQCSLKADKSTVLFIDGDSLGSALAHCEALFFELALKLPSVICCRCSPNQKALILEKVKKYIDKRTLAIGDGGNDVAMILKADLGVGVVGKEGMQASLAADFSIDKFCYLNRLLLWFGRISYKNTAKISVFVIHRGLIISLIQLLFSLMFYCSPFPLYNGVLILGYSTIFTALPVMTLLWDREITTNDVTKFPEIYRELQKGREMNCKSFRKDSNASTLCVFDNDLRTSETVSSLTIIPAFFIFRYTCQQIR